MSSVPVPIGIAVVEHNGCFLVGIREADTPLAGYAEFPGGKCRTGETSRETARRECWEETGLQVLPISLLHNQTFAYPHGTLALHFWLCRPAQPSSVTEQHRGFRWIEVSELATLQFPEANSRVIELLIARDSSE